MSALVGLVFSSSRPLDRQRLCVLCRLYGFAIHCAGHRLEHPRRVLRLRKLRLGGVFAVGAYTAVAFHKLGVNADEIFPEAMQSIVTAILPLPIPALIVLGGIVSGLIGLAPAT